MPQLRKFLILGAAAFGTAAAVLAAPIASANPLLPQCENTGGGTYGGQTTVCESPGNAQIDATPQVYPGEGEMGFWGFPGMYI